MSEVAPLISDLAIILIIAEMCIRDSIMTEKLQNALNEQITAELWSANLYLSMSFYLERERCV